MKKTITLCFLLSIGCANVFAQKSNLSTSPLKAQLKKLSGLMSKSPESTNKTTATMQRLKSTVQYHDMGTGLQPVDSAVFTYDFGRGSSFDYDILDYNTYYYYPNLLNSNYVMYDSTAHYISSGSSSSIKYNGTKPLSQTFYSGPSGYRTTWTYNTSGQVTSSADENFNPVTMMWEGNYRTFYTYDGSGKLVSDSSESHNLTTWDPQSKDVYTYTSSGMIESNIMYDFNGVSWDPQNRYTITYTGSQPTSSLGEFYNGTAWENDEKSDVTYSGSRKVTEKYYTWNGTSWDLESEEYVHLNGANLPDSSFYRDNFGSSWDTTITKLSYNSFSNPVMATYYDGSMNINSENHYYYQEYDPQGVKEIAKAKTLVVYPNPTTTQLNVSTTGMSNGAVRYSVLNSLGQAVLKATEQVAGKQITINVQGIAPGNYWLLMQDEKGTNYNTQFNKQ